MSPLVYSLLAGWTLIPGMLLMAASMVLLGGKAGPLAKLGAGVAALAIYLAAPGAPLAVVALFWTTIAIGFVLDVIRRQASRRLRLISRCGVLAALVLLAVFELPYRAVPRVPQGNFNALLIIGDSISANTGGEGKVWPARVSEQLGATLINAAFPGATVASALRRQVSQLGDDEGVVVIILGGNDVVGASDLPRFHDDLDALLAQVNHPGRPLIMFELPVPPWQTGYVRSQRALASKHKVLLIPRHEFIRVLRDPAATNDGFHLTDQGHARMAEIVKNLIAPAMSPPTVDR
jgi:lysophospholipase L1-like esterase